MSQSPTPAEPQEPVDPKNFLADLDPPKYDVIERSHDQQGVETREKKSD